MVDSSVARERVNRLGRGTKNEPVSSKAAKGKTLQERSIMFNRMGWMLVLLAVFMSGCVSVGRTDGIYTPGYQVSGLPLTGH